MDGEQEIRHWSRKDDEEALPHRSNLECAVKKMVGNAVEIAGVARRGHVADELDVAAERQPGDLPARPLPVGPSENLAAKAD